MLRLYAIENGKLAELDAEAQSALPKRAVWIDLVEPSDAEEQRVEDALGIEIPTRDEVTEIRTSSRLVSTEGTLYMSALVPYGQELDPVESLPCTFVRHGDRLITVHYGHPEAIDRLVERSRLGLVRLEGAESVLAALLEAVIDRIADRLEAVGDTLEKIERSVFRRGISGPRLVRRLSLGRRIQELQVAIERLGASHQVVVQLRACLASLERLVSFHRSHHQGGNRLHAIEEDLHAIVEHSAHLTNNMEFVLDAVVGLINVQQNKVIYILSILGVVLTPPVLVASVYGMNFKHMPELTWPFGYAWALGLMLISAVLPYLAVKWKGWL